MAVNLSPVGGVAAQFFDNSGNVLTGGKLYTYLAGTTTPAVTYTTGAGNVPWSNPIILDAAGRVSGSGEIWLTDTLQYKFILRDSNDVLIATYDNIVGINSNFVSYTNQQEIQTATAGQTVFNLATVQYQPGTNNLAVFVDGVNQYGPGAQYAYLETDANTVTFINGLHVGALVKFTTATQVSPNVTDAQNVSYTPPYTNSVTTNVEAKLSQYVSVIDFGADPTGVANSYDAFNNAIITGKEVYVPAGTYLINSPLYITNPTKIVGAGVNSTSIFRGFNPASDDEGLFNFRGGSSGSGMYGMVIRSKTGQTAGCLMSIVSTSVTNLGLYRFDHVDFTVESGNSHKYTIYMDGTAQINAPIGIRGVDMFACSVFGGTTSSLYVSGVLKFSFVGGGCYPAGGAPTSNVVFTGTATVPTQSFEFLPADCSCPVHFDYATLGLFGCGVMGAITNTTNASYINGQGWSGSVQRNWDNSSFLSSQTGLMLGINAGISNDSVPSTPGVSMYGSVTGKQGVNVTKIGQIGLQNSTVCPNGDTFTFTSQSGKLFVIATGGGAAVLAFADYKSAAITLLSNPSSEFVAGVGPSAGLTNIYKSSNSHVISVTNNTGGSVTYGMCFIGGVTSSVTDPA